MKSMELAKSIAVTAELCGTNFSEAAAEILATELAAYDRAQVLTALAKCRRELKGRLTMAAIRERMDDGRPSSDEAWATAIMAHDEKNTVCWTSETASAYWASRTLLDEGDKVGARMAFKGAYERAISAAKTHSLPVKWEITLGLSVADREPVVTDAVQAGRISLSYARRLVPELDGAVLPMIENLAKLG